jgi:hypothetical protein
MQTGSPYYHLITNVQDLPTSPESTTANFADDVAVLATDIDLAIASRKLQTDLLAIQNWFKKMENKSQYKQCATPPRRRYKVSWAPPLQETYLAQTQLHKPETARNHPHQNVLVTRMKVKTLYKQQISHT